MESRFLGSYVEEMRSSGAARFASANSFPVLVVRDVGAPSDDDDPAFQTKFMTRAEMLAALNAPERSDGEGAVSVGQVIPIRKREGGAFPDRIGVGRAPNVDVRISLSQVSKYHAYFSRTAEGSWALTDAGSRNGTSVQGTKLGERLPTPLVDGADVAIGPYRFTFHTEVGFVELVKRRAGAR